MDDVEVYGEEFDEITVREAIEDLDMLNDYKIITQLVGSEAIKEQLKDNPFVYDKEKTTRGG